MKEKFIITVTNNVEGCPIVKYFEPICSNVVIGTNIFSDIAASFSDFFGGYSDSYQNKLETIYDKAISSLKDKAIRLGANAIVGFSVDFDEISGGGKSMFMISASGVACIIKYPPKENDTIQLNSGILSQFTLDFEVKKRMIIKSINQGLDISSEWMQFLYEHPQKEIVGSLIDKYIKLKKAYPGGTSGIVMPSSAAETVSFITKYLTLLPKSDVVDEVYARIDESPIAKTLITLCNLYSPTHLLNVVKNNPKSAVFLLSAKTDYYQKEDLVSMKEILNIYDTLPDTGKIEMVKGGLLSKDQEKFVCENGHKSDKDSTYCETCGVNIKGLTIKQQMVIESLRAQIEVLEEFL